MTRINSPISVASNALGILLRPTLPIGLGNTSPYSIIGSTISNDGASACNRNIGTSTTPIAATGLVVGGESHIGDAVGIQALADVVAAYNYFRALPQTGTLAGDLIGRTILPGVLFAGAALGNSGTVTFNATGYPLEAQFVILCDAAVGTAAASQMVLINCQPSQIVWAILGAVTIATNSNIVGTVLSLAAIGLGVGAQCDGRLLSATAAVTLSANRVTT